MLDKIALISNEPVSYEEACSGLQGTYSHVVRTATKYHRKVYAFYRGNRKSEDHFLTVHCQPVLDSMGATKLELNPSKFHGFSEVTKTLTAFANNIGQYRITRIDHAVDVEVPVGIVHEALLFSRKKSREVYREGHALTGFYLGKYPEILAVYEKSAANSLYPKGLTRIELRQSREKVPVECYDDLPSLGTYKPFIRIEFTSPIPLERTLRTQSKVNILQEAIATFGAQGAYKVFNRHSNFRRDFKGCLTRPTNIPDLDKIYRENILAFFGGSNGH